MVPLARARAAGIRLLGPNCLGLVNVRARVPATFTPALLSGLPKPGGIAIVSQSGAFGMFAFVRARERGLGISHFLIRGFDPLIDAIDYGRELIPLTRKLIAERQAAKGLAAE